ncbi:DegT/DnrJ/EryC1/StrS family aminotransferase [Candidatus Omnitrophota bacterium]
MKLGILDLKLQYKGIKDEVDEALNKVLKEQSFILGDDVKAFEKEMADYCGVKYAIGVNSGTDALFLSLKALGIGQGDEVITSPYTFIATAEAIAQTGARPVFVDIDPKTYNIDPDLIEKAVSPSTKAIMPVHLYGQCADMDRITEIAGRHNIKVVEDCAQAINARYRAKKAASMGDASGISFFPGKNLGAFGDAGMITTNSEDMANAVKLLRVHGTVTKYIHSIVGYNSRLDNIQAAVLRVKLKHLDGWLDARRRNAEYYNKGLEGIPVEVPYVPSYNIHTYHLYVLRAKKDPQGLMRYLIDNGVENRTYYPIPLHLQECFKYLGYKKGDFPESEKASGETLAIPVYPELKTEQLDYVIAKIREFYKAG